MRSTPAASSQASTLQAFATRKKLPRGHGNQLVSSGPSSKQASQPAMAAVAMQSRNERSHGVCELPLQRLPRPLRLCGLAGQRHGAHARSPARCSR